jgi:hypothetical protein
MREVPSWTEIRKAIQKLANDNSPGKSGLTTDMLKSLPPKAFQLYANFIQEYKRDM